MSEFNDHHDRAMELASQAENARRAGDEAGAQSLFTEAMRLERQAAFLVPESLAVTRSVFIRSAASLAIDCREFAQAEQLIGEGLASNAPEEIREELRDLYETVTFQRHLELRGGRLSTRAFQFSLAGNSVAYGMVPAAEYVPRIQTLENMLVRTSERKRELPFRERRKPPKAIIEDLSLFMSAGMAASFAVTIRLGGPSKQQQLFHSPEEVVDEFLDCIRLFTEERREELRQRIGDEAYFRNFIHQARKIAPDGKRIRTVGFTVENTQVVIRGSPRSDWFTGPSSPDNRPVPIIGEVTKAEIQKKKNVIGIRDESGKVHTVSVPHGLMSDIVRPLWERRVRLMAERTPKGLNLLDIVAWEDEVGDQATKLGDETDPTNKPSQTLR